ncbi:hypothetical protein QLQ12_36035 [Actinoplanes sp. NEAU-A12]|uniref:Cation/H+ exchanger domain-containing protein n=1 Tax=Actinoplanes sandaracinus TaxID=3045177 RepID=A0ABT6WWE1_9ACTN|nr:hypothetical protein [Actinoplanes sandaracinus]MDI6104014.1 hypothetical protein [Actinoplanes sandaracinus]
MTFRRRLQRTIGATASAGFTRLLAFVAVVTAVALLAWWTGLTGVLGTPLYNGVAVVLLAIGLFASTSGINLDAARRDAPIVLLAVTVGVLLKTAIIAGVMYAVFRRPESVVLGVAVAQIDPLSVAALRREPRLSPRAQDILAAWSSFDDPITALMTVYLAAWLGTGPSVFGTGSALPQLALNLGLAGLAYGLWKLTGGRTQGKAPPWRIPAQRLLTIAVAVAAVSQFLMLALATAGLFLRPRIDWLLEKATAIAFWLAACAIGIGLGAGAHIVEGVVLGLAAYCSQILVSIVITRRLPRDDRVGLALGQQNGITAILLALLLEPQFPGTIAVVGPAVVVVNLLHVIANAVWNTVRRPGPGSPARLELAS